MTRRELNSADALADLVEPANFLMSAHVVDSLAMKEVLRIGRANHRRLSAQKRLAHCARRLRGYVVWWCGKFTPKTGAVI
jgi:hypothetical protein